MNHLENLEQSAGHSARQDVGAHRANPPPTSTASRGARGVVAGRGESR